MSVLPDQEPCKTLQHADPVTLQGYGTRTERREAVIAGWRKDMLAGLTSPVIWAILAAAYLSALGLAIGLRSPLPSAIVAITATAIAWAIWWKLHSSDQKRRSCLGPCKSSASRPT